jgi:hypothetical protein
MYVDKLDGVVDTAFFERKSGSGVRSSRNSSARSLGTSRPTSTT